MWPFNRKKKVYVQDLEHTPAADFELAVMHTTSRGLERIWSQSNEIDELTDHIEHLMEIRSQRTKERSDLVIAVNKQRKLFGLEEIDDEGRVASEQADDETYALEP